MWEFKLGGTEELKQLSERLGVQIEATDDVSILAKPVQAGGLLIPNSLAVHPMEGCDGDSQGRPGKLTLRRYERFAAGGAGLLWVEATAVVPEGRANPRQLWLHEKNKDSFRAMVEMIRQAAAESNGPKHRPVMVLQLTHSGTESTFYSPTSTWNSARDSSPNESRHVTFAAYTPGDSYSWVTDMPRDPSPSPKSHFIRLSIPAGK